MRNLILVALTFHLLVITVAGVNHNYTFGDIISFPRTCLRIKKAYKHFAVYVGNVFGQGDMDIFHRRRKPTDGKYCVFGSLKNESTHQKENDMDRSLTPLNKTEIIKRIKVMNTTEICGNYNLWSNNCEHLVTYVRYGKAFVKQNGTTAGYFIKVFKINNDKTEPKADEAVEILTQKLLDKHNENFEDFTKILDVLNENSAVEDECGF